MLSTSKAKVDSAKRPDLSDKKSRHASTGEMSRAVSLRRLLVLGTVASTELGGKITSRFMDAIKACCWPAARKRGGTPAECGKGLRSGILPCPWLPCIA